MDEHIRHRAVERLEGEPSQVARTSADATEGHLGHSLRREAAMKLWRQRGRCRCRRLDAESQAAGPRALLERWRTFADPAELAHCAARVRLRARSLWLMSGLVEP